MTLPYFTPLRDLRTFDHGEVQLCDIHDYRPYTKPPAYPGAESRTYWRCVWCFGVTCGHYTEADPCWEPYHHKVPHRARSGITWPVGGNPPPKGSPS